MPVENSAAFEEYVQASLSGIPRGSFSRLREAILKIIEVEGPIHQDMVVKRLIDHYGGDGRDAQFRGLIANEIVTLVGSRRARRQDHFLLCREGQLTRKPRKPGVGGERRKIEHIPTSELRTAVLMTVREMFGGSEEEILRQTARNLGYQRTGSTIALRLGGVLAEMLRDEHLNKSFGSIVEHKA